MSQIRIHHRVRAREAMRAFQAAPEIMERNVSAKLKEGAHVVARAAKMNASKHDAFGTNTQAIRVEEVSALHFRVVAGMNYSRALEEGTGPEAGRARYIPNRANLEQYIKRRGGIRWGRAGSRKRRTQEREVRDRSFGLLLYIVRKGTKPHPFMAPAVEEKRSEVHRLVQQGVWLGIAETLGP